MSGPQAQTGRRRARFLFLRLSVADLWHEWILTLCLILAVSAVLSPLMTLFGLKSGTIETMRHRLVQDPRNREIRPMVSKSFDRAWFKALAARGDVAFVIPTTRQISANLEAVLKDKPKGPKASLDISPTGPGDRLLLENGGLIPEQGQCVLTASAAEDLGAATGQTLTASVRRLVRSQYQTASLDLKIAAVLDPRAGSLKRIYVGLPVLEAIEAYKDGRAVPEYHWPGSTARAYPVFDGLVAALPQPLSKLEQFKLINNTGLTVIKILTGRELDRLGGPVFEPPGTVYLLKTRRKPVDEDSLVAVKNRLRGKGAFLLPWVGDLEVELVDDQGRGLGKIGLAVLNDSLNQRTDIKLKPAPAWPETGPAAATFRRVLLPAGLDSAAKAAGLKLTVGERRISVPLKIEPGEAPGPAALVPARLAGILRLFKERNLELDEERDVFVLERRGYAGFRLYAKTIDDVPGLKKHLESQGITVHTEADRIRDVAELDRYLSLIFWLIALVASVGGAASLTASLYASVERKRRELSVLRLIGLPGPALLRFPIYQGLIITGSGFAVALAFFESLAWTINSLFQVHLQTDESLCRLSLLQLSLALVATLGLAALAGAVAAWRTTRIEPAEALRDE